MARKAIYSESAPDPIGPYSQAIFINGMLFVSGQICLDAFSGTLLMNSIEEETTQVMENLKAILEAAEMDFSNVVKCSIFLKDMGTFPKVNEVYGRYFGKTPPARETVEVSRLPRNVNVEISCIAMR
jgi:2-iminobutanoate/2-iminopropanoate deaminase